MHSGMKGQYHEWQKHTRQVIEIVLRKIISVVKAGRAIHRKRFHV